MLRELPIENVLCLDIETVPQYANYNECPESLKTLWKRKANNLRKDKEDDTEETMYSRAGIYSEFGKIICISVGYLVTIEGQREFRMKSYSGHDESEILKEFSGVLNKFRSSMILCAHNGKEFDYPYLCRRMIIHGIPLPEILDNHAKKPWEIQHLDTMELWKFGDYKNYTPLNLLAYILNIPSPKDDIDGSMVGEVYWREKDLQRIIKYCQKDVITVMQILLRLKGSPLLSDEEVFIDENQM